MLFVYQHVVDITTKEVTMNPKNNRRSQMTRRLLRDALVELMQDKSFSDITIKELCERADLNRTTFYLHYPNQEALLKDVEENLHSKTSDFIRSIRETDDKVSNITLLLEYIRDNSSLFRTLLCRNPNGSFQETFLNYIGRVVGEGKIKKIRSSDRAYVQSYLIYGCLGIIVAWINDRFKMSSVSLAELIYSMSHGAFTNMDAEMK